MVISASFTGTRKGLTDAQKQKVRELLMGSYAALFHHGDCVGADADAHDIAKSLFFSINIYPSDLEEQRAFKKGAIVVHDPKPPLARNRDIVKAGDFLIACPNGIIEQRRSGTWSTIRYARSLRKKIFIIYPDGEVHEEN